MRRPKPSSELTPRSHDDALLDEMVAMIARSAARDAANGGPAPRKDAVVTTADDPHLGRSTIRVRKRQSKLAPSHRPLQATSAGLSESPKSGISDDTGIDHPCADPNPSQHPLTLREIASSLSVSESVARDLLRKGKLVGFKVGGQWRAMPSAVSDFIITQLAKR